MYSKRNHRRREVLGNVGGCLVVAGLIGLVASLWGIGVHSPPDLRWEMYENNRLHKAIELRAKPIMSETGIALRDRGLGDIVFWDEGTQSWYAKVGKVKVGEKNLTRVAHPQILYSCAHDLQDTPLIDLIHGTNMVDCSNVPYTFQPASQYTYRVSGKWVNMCRNYGDQLLLNHVERREDGNYSITVNFGDKNSTEKILNAISTVERNVWDHFEAVYGHKKIPWREVFLLALGLFGIGTWLVSAFKNGFNDGE